jgi:hypothetical protein
MRKAVLLAVLAGIAAVVAATASGRSTLGFKTSQGPMLDPVAAGVSYEPIITVGDTFGSYMFESIPDGIAIAKGRSSYVDVYVNHETSTVPFPYNGATGIGFNDFTNAMVSKLTMTRGRSIMEASYTITSDQNYQRFCASFLAGEEHGFDMPLLLTNEEGIDWVNRTGEAWPATIGSPAARQIGAVVAIDERTGESRPIWGMGRLNHENSVAIPGYRYPVVLTGDDTFVSNPPQSQLYSYIADDGEGVWDDEGDLWALVVDGAKNYYDFPVGSTVSRTGKFVKVPKDIATGRMPDGRDMMAADKGYPAPPSDGTWQRDARTNVGIDGPQWVLEHWGDIQPQPVFQFIRVEYIAYDRTNPNVVYVVDSGRGATSSAFNAGNAFLSTNGRVFKLVLDPKDPTKVTSFSVLIEGDDKPVKAVDEIHQPDNIESTKRSLLIQEDPGSSQQFPPGSDQPGSPNYDPAATTARIWQYDLASGTMRVVAKVNQSADEGPTDEDAAPRGNLGAWESSGIVDASRAFGPGTFLVDVQAGSLVIDEEVRGKLTYQRDGGQLGLLRIPGA